jgi:hydrogenase nickel incorporation protein HypA/HybF
MHEYSLAQSIMQIVIAEAEKVSARKVTKVTLTLGELAGVLPDSLSFCFDLVTKGTIAVGALLEIEKVPLKGYCPHCEKAFFIMNHQYLCDQCGNGSIELISGQELQVSHLEIEDETD